jgi:hypothetical protein
MPGASSLPQRSWAGISITLASAWAQVSGQIAGMVKDQSQAVVSGAKVTLRNQATGLKQSAITDAAGSYAFPIVAVGTYELNIESAGFKPFKRGDLVVNIGSSTQIDTSLEVAGQSQTVNVTEEGVRVETSDTKLGQVIMSKQVTDVPLNGRSYTDLFAIQGGVTPLTTGAANEQHFGRRFWYRAGGGQWQYGTVLYPRSTRVGQRFFPERGQRAGDHRSAVRHHSQPGFDRRVPDHHEQRRCRVRKLQRRPDRCGHQDRRQLSAPAP